MTAITASARMPSSPGRYGTSLTGRATTGAGEVVVLIALGRTRSAGAPGAYRRPPAGRWRARDGAVRWRWSGRLWRRLGGRLRWGRRLVRWALGRRRGRRDV